MALLAGHKRFEDFTIVAAKAGIADGYPGATKARTIVWACIFVVSYLLPKGECSERNTLET